jgi:hypothetical protein
MIATLVPGVTVSPSLAMSCKQQSKIATLGMRTAADLVTSR